MDIISVNNEQVIECVHCKGTGICKHADYQWKDNYVWFECTKCGKGVKRYGVKDGIFSTRRAPDYLKPPVCGVCSGKGYTRV